MELSAYFQPVKRIGEVDKSSDFYDNIASVTSFFSAEGDFPTLDDGSVVIFGADDSEAADEVRHYLYSLAKPAEDMHIADLGNMKPVGNREELMFAFTEVMYKLLEKNLTVLVIGGGQDLSYANYKAYEVLGRVINIASIDSRFDLGVDSMPLSSSNWLSHIVAQQPNFLFNFANIGYQTYFNGAPQVRLMSEIGFDAYRLGTIQSDMVRAETLVRSADMVSVDISSVRLSDAPGQEEGSPHGFYGEELCRLARFAGMSDKLTSMGFYNYKPLYDRRGQTAHLLAHAIWYFIEGFYNRYADFPHRDKHNYKHYLVGLNDGDFEISFYKSKKSERWWMEVPYSGEMKERYQPHLLIPCTYADYQQAQQNEVPELWMKYYERFC